MGFMTGRKIYDNFTNGTGPDGLSGGAAIVNEVAAGYGERAEAIRRIAAKMEAAWQGEAAGAARRGVGPLEVEHALAGMDLATAQDLTNRQAGSFADARNAVVPVPPEPTKPDPWAVFRSPGDVVTYQQQVAEYNAASQHNVDVMTGYAGASSFNAKGLPQAFGSLTNDQAGIAIDSGKPPSDGGDRGDDTSRRVSGRLPPKSDGGPPVPTGGESSDAGEPVRPSGEQPPQQTSPGGFTPAPGGPVPVGGGGTPGPGLPVGGGLVPGTGLVPVGGGVGDGGRPVGGRGGPGGSGGRGPEKGVGGRAPEPHGPGGRAGPLAGGGPGEPAGAGGRAGAPGAAGRGAGAMSGVPMAAGGRGRGEDDTERTAPEYLREDDPEGLFGTDEQTAPPVIGEDLEPPQPELSTSTKAE